MNDMLLNINKIREYINDNKIYLTKHFLNRIQQRNILIKDIKDAINTGEVIEYYEDDYPYESCLVYGYNLNNKVIHIVCGINKERLILITAYYPDNIKWEDDFKTRRRK